jgi:hypothetical protein
LIPFRKETHIEKKGSPMKSLRMPLTHQLLVALFLLISFAPRVVEAQSSVALRATILITETIQTIGAPPCVLLGNVSGTGVATHLGKVTLASTDCINPLNPDFTLFSFASNSVALSLANDDQISAKYFGTLTVEGPVGVITGGFEITGGTGRYAGATGAGTVQGVEDMTTGKGQIQLIGTISY